MPESSSGKARKEGINMKTSGILAFLGFLALCADCEDMNLFLLSKLAGFALIGAACLAYKFSRIKSDDYER